MELTIPYNYTPYPYQNEIFEAYNKWIKRIIQVRHRRAWKDKTDWNILIKAALQRVWIYYIFFPTYSQGKKAFWDNIDKDWYKVRDHLPKILVKKTNDTEMKIQMVNGSIIQVIWTDNYNSIVWTNPVWMIFSEFSLQDPAVWSFMRPILLQNDWWAIFNFTPRSKNHAFFMLEKAKENKERFVSVKTAKETIDNNWNRIITDKQLESERAEMDEDIFLQEYMCSFAWWLQWAYYTNQFKKIDNEDRITTVKYDEALPVYTFWDLGINDTTVIIFAQFLWKEIRIINHIEENNNPLSHYVKLVKEYQQKTWCIYKAHYLPHDVKAREQIAWVSRYDKLVEYGLWTIEITPSLGVNDWIDMVRDVLNYTFIDKSLERFISCLRDYKKEYDDKNKIYKNKPLHDWTSNSADAMRYLAINHKALTDNNFKYNNAYAIDFNKYL